MPKVKKAQNAASRKDKFYKRAKEKGYRARSAFKLVHLNNLHGFLKKAKVCLDLCAAPGSWMQVAREFMPTGSVIVGVDLNSIKRLTNTISLKGDITTDSLRTELRGTLKGYKADIVLHDGAPNVGRNWTQDAYDQNILVLHAFKLACEFLRHGGDFVTKVFRSKDSPSLEFVFKALFKSVESTKPQASRYESAEIFYVCRYYKMRPEDKLDPKFFDPKEVFHEVEPTLAPKINLHKPEKINRKAVGYEEGVQILYKEATVTEFVESDRFEELLQTTSAVVFDDERWSSHPSTSFEIAECCKDIKVLGRKELRMLLTWRRGLRAELNAEKKVASEAAAGEEGKPAPTQEEEEEEELKQAQQQIEELEAQTAKDDKKQQKVVRRQRRELQQKLKMLSMGGHGDTGRDDDFFNLNDMEKIKDEQLLMDQYDASDSDDEPRPRQEKVRYRKGDFELDDDGIHFRRVGEVSDSESDEDLAEVGEGLFKRKNKGKRAKEGDIEIVPREDMAKKHKKAIRFASGEAAEDSDSETSSSSDDENDEQNPTEQDDGASKKKMVRFADDVQDNESDGDEDINDDNEWRTSKNINSSNGRQNNVNDSGLDDFDADDDDNEGNYTTDLVGDDPQEKKERTAESWFSQNKLEDLIGSDDEMDIEADEAIDLFKRIGGKVYGQEKENDRDSDDGTENKGGNQNRSTSDTNRDGEDLGVDDASTDTPSKFDSKTTTETVRARVARELDSLVKLEQWVKRNQSAFPSKVVIPSTGGSNTTAATVAVPDINTVSMDDWGSDIEKPQCDPSNAPKRLADLDAVGLALATKLVTTKKAKRDLTLQGWNRYMKGEEEGLPNWFTEDEDKNCTAVLDVADEEVNYYTARDKAINTRTLKKVMEAKVRKQRRFKKTMQTVVKKAEALQGSSLMSDIEKQQEIKSLYKKAMKTREKKETQYVVMSTKNKGKKPKGIKGKYKMVDARLKKDVRAKLKLNKKKKTFARGGKKGKGKR